MKVAAFDLSLVATGYAGPNGVAVLSTSNRGFARLRWIRDAVLLRAGELVVLEGYGFAPGRGNAAREMGELGGVVRLALFEAGIPFADISPASLKKYATGKGNAPKEEVLAAAIRRLSYAGHDNNEADALWLYAMAMDHAGAPIVTVPQAHREALEKVNWPRIAQPVST